MHWRRGTVEKSIVKWLLVGSVPAAFAGVFVIRLFGAGDVLQSRVQLALGAALVIAAFGIVGKSYLDARRRRGLDQQDGAPVKSRPAATVLVGAVVGLIVGMTSVGSGSLMIVLLMLVYPMLTSRRLVGTDLVQAVPLVGAAALGHVLVGDFKLALTLSILIGSIPGVYIGSRLSASAPDVVVRPILVFVLACVSDEAPELQQHGSFGGSDRRRDRAAGHMVPDRHRRGRGSCLRRRVPSGSRNHTWLGRFGCLGRLASRCLTI